MGNLFNEINVMCYRLLQRSRYFDDVNTFLNLAKVLFPKGWTKKTHNRQPTWF